MTAMYVYGILFSIFIKFFAINTKAISPYHVKTTFEN